MLTLTIKATKKKKKKMKNSDLCNSLYTNICTNFIQDTDI